MNKENQQDDLVNLEVQFKLKQINLLEHALDIPEPFDHSLKFRYQLNCDINFRKDTNQAIVLIKYHFLTFDDKSVIFSMKVETIFEIQQIAVVLDLKHRDFMKQYALYIVTISLNQCRGMQAMLIDQTKLSGFYLPILVEDGLWKKMKLFEDGELIGFNK